MNIWLNILLILVLVSIIVMEVAENGHPIRTLAWIMVLIFLPVVGLILYFFFGRDRKKRRLATPEDANRMQELTAVAVGDSVPRISRRMSQTMPVKAAAQKTRVSASRMRVASASARRAFLSDSSSPMMWQFV